MHVCSPAAAAVVGTSDRGPVYVNVSSPLRMAGSSSEEVNVVVFLPWRWSTVQHTFRVLISMLMRVPPIQGALLKSS